MSTTYRASKTGLSIVEEAQKAKGWKAQSQKWCEQAYVSLSTLRRFRQRNSIRENYFIAICKAVGIDNWQEIVDPNPLPLSNASLLFFAYDDETWVGRKELVHDLTQKLQNRCRLLLITG
ncbi:MAG: ATP-binding protein, partial [Symploca sp. SIO1B1]|nr:ATP-binding protein [Symploca sp. SIO1B1]